jgi:hypothetical protein
MSAVACQVCGVATEENREHRDVRTNAGVPFGTGYEIGTCVECVTLDPLRPGLAVRAALRVLGKPNENDDLASRAFEAAGVDVTAVLYDRGEPTGGPGQRGPQRKAFAHVGNEGREALRKGYARLLDFRVHAASDHDRPVPPTAPPHGPGGCLLCGVGKAAAWRPVLTSALTRGPEMIDGHLCGTCADQYDTVGAMGQPLIEKACLEAAGLPWSEAMRAPGLKPWIALDFEPREVGWDWVELAPPRPDLTPLQALQSEVADLRAEVAALREAVGT